MTILIRRTEPTDAEGLQAVMTNKNAYTETLQLPNPSLAMWQKRLANIPDHVHPFVAVCDNEIVGHIWLTVALNPRRQHTAEIGMAVADNFHGQGIGTKLMQTAVTLADNWLNLQRLELTVYTDNKKAIGLYQKFGFEIEGEHKKFAFRNGEFVNAYAMARLKPLNQLNTF